MTTQDPTPAPLAEELPHPPEADVTATVLIDLDNDDMALAIERDAVEDTAAPVEP